MPDTCFSYLPDQKYEYDRAFFWMITQEMKKMLKVLVHASIGLLNDGGTICFEMDLSGVRDDQDPS
jgi:hypothetical protein